MTEGSGAGFVQINYGILTRIQEAQKHSDPTGKDADLYPEDCPEQKILSHQGRISVKGSAVQEKT